MFTLYDYQEAAVQATMEYLKTEKGNPIIIAPTGAGKSVIISELIKRLNLEHKNICIITHRETIIKQNYNACTKQLNSVYVGIYSAGLNSRDVLPITFASINSIYNKQHLFKHFTLFLIDECHLVPDNAKSMYQQFFAQIPNYKAVGLTATPFRHKDLMFGGHDNFFTDVSYEIDFMTLLEKQKLCNLVSYSSRQQFDTKGIKKTGGDYNTKQLSHKFDRNEITEKIINEIVANYLHRKAWLLFCIDINHATNVHKCLLKKGVKSCLVHSKLNDNAKTIDDFKSGLYQAMVSVAVLTTGFDAPQVDLIGILRATDSITLHVQMIGRGARICEGKKDCIVLDYAGNIDRLGPINMPYLEMIQVAKKNKEPPTKICINCLGYIKRHLKKCPLCGFKIKDKQEEDLGHNLQLKPSKCKVLDQRLDDMLTVDNIYYSIKKSKKTGLEMFCIVYSCYTRKFIDFLCFDHEGYARTKAIQIWHSISEHKKAPLNSKHALALAKSIKKITHIGVRKK
ncbi:MAG: DNA or RNA helicase of superfamily II [Candidatus Magnetoglobus multicellularis str. Araruama]|uniref:DNA or RNA helicase of superfamily II n=1 Tax=Candidatus Magnetoglobus multicellularis str. Araruama TaxID=890399 RepID=A0A1V1PH06_9BACT|nr:MAG: DNA or RNA helicase of superfamily II [Candidatus Magnetoglobus multicellularis str. Araruama]